MRAACEAVRSVDVCWIPPQLSTRTAAPLDAMALAATATPGQQDEATTFQLLRTVGAYLDMDTLMPPMRLRWSRILG